MVLLPQPRSSAMVWVYLPLRILLYWYHSQTSWHSQDLKQPHHRLGTVQYSMVVRRKKCVLLYVTMHYTIDYGIYTICTLPFKILDPLLPQSPSFVNCPMSCPLYPQYMTSCCVKLPLDAQSVTVPGWVGGGLLFWDLPSDIYLCKTWPAWWWAQAECISYCAIPKGSSE